MSFMLTKASQIARWPGDPKVIETGPSSLKPQDRLGRALGWFSIGLGLTELVAPRKITKTLGVEGKEALVRAFGARELLHGMLCLSTNNDVGAATRVGGDMLDLAALAAAYRDDNPKKANVGIAMAAIVGCMAADFAAARSIRNLHRRKGPVRDFSDHSGFPKGIGYSRGKAAQERRPVDDFRAAPAAANASKVTGETTPAVLELQKTLESAER
jgi:hypothetical protein